MTKGVQDRFVKTELDALLTALYVHLDDHVLVSAARRRGRGRPRTLTDAEVNQSVDAVLAALVREHGAIQR